MNHPVWKRVTADPQAPLARGDRDGAGWSGGGRPRWVLTLAVVLGSAAVAGFLAGRLWWAAGGARPGGGGPSGGYPRRFSEPAFSPQATVHQLKQEAIRTAERLREAYPDNPDSLAVSARLQYSLGHTDQARQLWERAAAIDPGFVPAYFGLGVIAKESGDFETAVTLFQRVVALAPAEPQAPYLLGESLMKLGRPEEAVLVLDTHVHTQAPLAAAVATLGLAYYQLGKYDKAKQTFEALIQADPNDPQGHFGLGKVYAKEGQRDKAREHLEKYRSLVTENPKEVVRRSRRSEDPAWGREVLSNVLVQSGQVYRSQGQLAEAETMWQKAACLADDHALCRRELLSLYEEQGRDHDALRVCRELCRIEPQVADHWFNAGVLHARLDQPQAARTALEKALQIAPDDPRYRQAYAWIQGGP